MTARPEDRSRSLARLTAARACSLAGVAPAPPAARSFRPRPPNTRGRGLCGSAGAELRKLRTAPVTASAVAGEGRALGGVPPRLGWVARRRAVRGPPPFAPRYNGPKGRRLRALPGARGAARSRPRVAPVCGPRGAPRRNARRVSPHPPRNAKKMPHGGSSGPPCPLAGARVPLAPWRLFRPPGNGAHFPLASMRCSGFWLPWLHPLARLPGSRECRGQGDCPLWGPASLGLVPRSVVLPPAFPWPSVSPFRRAVGGCRPLPPHGARPWAAPAARAGGNGIQKVQRLGERTKAGKTAQGTLSARLGAGSVRFQLRY